MVFQSVTLFARSRGPDEFWRKRRIFKLAAHFRGRDRNCYSNAIRAVHHSLQFVTKHRKITKAEYKTLWQTRIDAACAEHGANLTLLKIGLMRCQIQLDHKSLADLAVWEPRTFKSLIKIAAARVKQDGLNIIQHLQKPAGVITRGMIK